MAHDRTNVETFSAAVLQAQTNMFDPDNTKFSEFRVRACVSLNLPTVNILTAQHKDVLY